MGREHDDDFDQFHVDDYRSILPPPPASADDLTVGRLRAGLAKHRLSGTPQPRSPDHNALARDEEFADRCAMSQARDDIDRQFRRVHRTVLLVANGETLDTIDADLAKSNMTAKTKTARKRRLAETAKTVRPAKV